MTTERKPFTPSKRMSTEARSLRDFVDALRECLDLAPLYRGDGGPTMAERFGRTWPDPSSGFTDEGQRIVSPVDTSYRTLAPRGAPRDQEGRLAHAHRFMRRGLWMPRQTRDKPSPSG
jgi:hypothetical protein